MTRTMPAHCRAVGSCVPVRSSARASCRCRYCRSSEGMRLRPECPGLPVFWRVTAMAFVPHVGLHRVGGRARGCHERAWKTGAALTRLAVPYAKKGLVRPLQKVDVACRDKVKPCPVGPARAIDRKHATSIRLGMVLKRIKVRGCVFRTNRAALVDRRCAVSHSCGNTCGFARNCRH